jgi:hypothetical protein
VGRRNKPYVTADIVGNIYEVYREKARKTLLRKVQVVKFDHPDITLKLLERYDHDGIKTCFYPQVSMHAIRQHEWKLVEVKAPIVESASPPIPVVSTISNRGDKYPQGKVIYDVRKDDVWEVRGSNSNLNNAIALVKVMEVTDEHIYFSTLERDSNIRVYRTIGRGSLRDGRYRLVERNNQEPPIEPRVNGTVPEVPIKSDPPSNLTGKVRVPIEMISWIENDRKNNTLSGRYSHMTYHGNIVVAKKIEESGNILFEFEWNPND